MSDEHHDQPDHPDLAALLRGELSNAAALDAAGHARSCPACADDLVDLSLGHGLLSAARRTLAAPPVSTPREGSADEAPSTESPAASAPSPLARPRDRPPRGRRRRAPALVAAAAVLAMVGGAATFVLGRDGQPSPDPAVATRTASLEPVSPSSGTAAAGAPGGRVSMSTDRLLTHMRVDTAKLPSTGKGRFYYVWLLDPRTNKMLPLGQVAPGRPATFDVPESLVEAYSAIDISLEDDDGDPGHSVTSVLRASYAAPS